MTQRYTPRFLKLWTYPDNYSGKSWDGYYSSGFGQHRDSDCLSRSNFRVAWEALNKVSKAARIVRESHWAVGWIEWIAIPSTASATLKEADEMLAAVEQYPVLSDNDFSDLESEEANEIWANCYTPKERIKYIREHNHDWGFRNLADMLGCVRGKYFAGYASELIG
jgi:hypothetical protein